MAIRIGRLHGGDLIARRLAPCRMVLAAAPSYLAAHGTPQRVADLSAHNCLTYTLASAPIWSFGAGGAVRAEVRGNLQANNDDALLIAARAGLGVVHEPSFILGDDLRAGTLVALMLDHPSTDLDGVHAVYPSNRRPPARLRAFIDFAVDRCGPAPPWDEGLA